MPHGKNELMSRDLEVHGNHLRGTTGGHRERAGALPGTEPGTRPRPAGADRRPRPRGRAAHRSRARTGTSKAATYAILQTLLAHRFVADFGAGANRRYRLGLSLARLGDLAVGNIALADIALPVLRELTAESGLTSRVAILDEGYAVVVGRIDAPGAVRFDAALGRRELPHCSAVGKALLAARPAEDARAILRKIGLPRRTPKTITSLTAPMATRRDRSARLCGG